VHVATLVLDCRSGLRWMDVVVPFVSTRNALWYGLGTLGFELLAVLVVSSLLRKHLPYAVSRGLHWLAYLCWTVAFAHGIGAGSDAGSVWMLLVSGACLVLVMWSVTTRLLGPNATGPASSPGSGQAIPQVRSREPERGGNELTVESVL
jgi:sulfoxide reductase heme-binding subunit YedZ